MMELHALLIFAVGEVVFTILTALVRILIVVALHVQTATLRMAGMILAPVMHAVTEMKIAHVKIKNT